MWERYCLGMQAIVFLVDSADSEHFSNAKKELHSLMNKPRLAGIPLLVLANKNDLDGAMQMETVVDHLSLNEIKSREVCYYSISCKNKVNIDITLKWLTAHSA